MKENPRTVWRPMRIVAEGYNFALQSCPAQSGRNVYSALAFFGAIGDVLAIGGPVRHPVLAGTLGDLDWVATADLLNPDVVFSAAIGTVGNEAAVRRPGGPSLQAVIERDPSKGALDGRCRNTRTPFPVGKPSCD
jgi:hypothetical protein